MYIQQRGQWAGPRLQLFDGQGTPPVTPFGVQTNEQNGTRSVSINVSSAALRKWCEDVDALVLQAAQSNSTAWLGKEYDADTLGMFYRKLMAPAREGYDPCCASRLWSGATRRRTPRCGCSARTPRATWRWCAGW